MKRLVFFILLFLSLAQLSAQDSVPPSPGYRENWLYRNGHFTPEWEYDYHTEGGSPLVSIHLFRADDGSGTSIWLQNLRLSQARFERIIQVFSDSVLVAVPGTHEEVRPGVWKPVTIHLYQAGPHGQTSDITVPYEDVRRSVLKAILKSRKPSKPASHGISH